MRTYNWTANRDSFKCSIPPFQSSICNRDYLAGGKFPLPGIERTVERAAQLVTLFRGSGMPVIHIRHFEMDPAVGFLLGGSPGAEIDPRVAPQGEDLLITKNYPNAFRDTTLAKNPTVCLFCREGLHSGAIGTGRGRTGIGILPRSA